MNLLALLPATPHEIGALLSITAKQATGRLHYWAKCGKCKRTERITANGNTGRGAHTSRIWVPL